MRSEDDRYSISWLMRCSRSFENTDRFGIGRHELASSPDIFVIGVINASLFKHCRKLTSGQRTIEQFNDKRYEKIGNLLQH